MRHRRRGIIFVTALGIIVVLTGLALVFAQSMRTEALASANRRSQAQADSIELGAEQWVLAQIDEYPNDAYTLATQVQSDTISVGTQETTGYFWVLPADLTNVQGPVCGITDESSKLNINMGATGSTAGKAALINGLQNLCDSLNVTLPDDTPYSIYNWTHATTDPNGATDTDYSSLAEPYQIKSQSATAATAPFESLEELLLVGQQQDIQQGVMPQLLWGTDTGRNTIRFEWAEGGAGPSGGLTSGSANANAGLSNYLTVYSLIPSAAANANRLVNPFTASSLVLQALGMTQSQAESVIEAREANTSSSGNASGSSGYRWALTAAGLPVTGGIANYLTGASYRYSADIVAVSADGRAFKRVRIVVDVSQYNPLATTLGTTTPPAVIIYRKDLTAYGWPLPGTQKSFQDLVARGPLATGWLGSMLTSSGTMGQGH